MQFSDGEMVFMNSLTSDENSLNLKCGMPGILNEEIYIQKTLKKLVEKGILDNNNNLSEKGIVCVYILERFKASKKQIVINNMHISMLDNSGNAICIIQNSWTSCEMIMVKCSDIFLKILSDCSYLKRKTKNNIESIKKIEIKEWKERIQGFTGNILCFNIIENDEKTHESIFYWNNDEGFEYDMLTQIERSISPQYMIRFLMSKLEIDIVKYMGD